MLKISFDWYNELQIFTINLILAKNNNALKKYDGYFKTILENIQFKKGKWQLTHTTYLFYVVQDQ